MNFQRELATYELISELLPLFFLHWKEIAHFPDIMLEPDTDAYLRAEATGNLRVFTARDDSGEAIGYAVFFLRQNPHYKSSLQASQDILFIKPDRRGTGMRLIKWCDEQLALEGVQAVYHHVKQAHNFGPMLERIGYEPVEYIYTRRLDK